MGLKKCLTLLALLVALAGPTQATVTTTGPGNPVNAQATVPGRSNTVSCQTIKIGTTTPTQVDAADAARMGDFFLNVSTRPLGSSASALPYPRIWITTAATVSATTTQLLVPQQLNQWISGLVLGSCDGPTSYAIAIEGALSTHTTPPCRLDRLNQNVGYTGAIWAIAESSGGTTGYDPLPFLTYCKQE